MLSSEASRWPNVRQAPTQPPVCLTHCFAHPKISVQVSSHVTEDPRLGQIEELSGQTVADCYQCGCCTAGCPIGTAMDPPPSKAIRLLQLGRAGELLASEGIWLCASCLVCGTRCPRGVDYARIAEACRAIVLRGRHSRVDPDTVTEPDLEEIPQQAFMASFRKFSV
mgnify:CR=1 FL=1|uniref:Heterodisulfide reductase n=1 Tax=candidate division WOR-3 bacterium TaxID=2052148 RepID=A0A7C4CAV9_UNCW3